MSQQINWLHLTDLHYGIDSQGWLWPRLKREFMTDVQTYTNKFGGFDIVFFTGDLTQQGTSAEFGALTKELETLWKEFSKDGHSPLFCPIPGNHDLIRPHKHDAATKALTALWHSDSSLRNEFWRNPDCEYRQKVSACFEPYQAWLKSLPIPTPDFTHGILPGDYSTVINKKGLHLGVIGLNSAFLQIIAGDFKGKLDLHVAQLNAVCNGDPDSWLNLNLANLLLTHHAPSWLSPSSLEHFRNEIYPPGRFLVHLCGHQHEPESTESSEGGGPPRRLRLAPSLFGLENWADNVQNNRIHGYIAGQFTFDSGSGVERYWPRLAIKGQHGAFRLRPDHTFELMEDDCVVRIFAADKNDAPSAAPVTTSPVPASQSITLQLFDDTKRDTSRLIGCPRVVLLPTPQHRAIRLEEQSQAELALRKTRTAWIVADWGVGRDGFLGTVLDRFKEEPTQEVYQARCDEAPDFDTLQTCFRQQFTMTIQEFAHLVSSDKGTVLIFDSVHPGLVSSPGVQQLLQLTSALLDFCPNLRVIISSRLKPPVEPIVELRPLDGPDVRAYVTNHPEASPGLGETDVIDKLHERSDGLPMHLDRMLKSLRIASLDDVLEIEFEHSTTNESTGEATPRALVDAVATLAGSQDKRTRRSLRLLKVLTVLPHGETLERIKHLLPAEPFFAENASQLVDAALLESIPLQQASAKVGAAVESDALGQKLLRVPRQVRDYVNSLLSEQERLQLVEASAERLLGPRWREGILKLKPAPAEYREYAITGAGNEFAILHILLSNARASGDIKQLRRLVKIGLAYADHLNDADRYRDVLIVTRALQQLITRSEAGESWHTIVALHGGCLRMIGKEEEALGFLKEALASKDLSRETRASILLDLALTEEDLGHEENAIAAAEEAKSLCNSKESDVYLQAAAIQAGLQLEGQEQMSKLAELERLARGKHYDWTALNLSLDMAHNALTPQERLSILERIQIPAGSGYTSSRAIITKVKAIRDAGYPRRLKPAETAALSQAYSYLYTQRFNQLFDDCHAALWHEFEQLQDTPRLARLFRFSSFVWRIRGEHQKELDCMKSLQQRQPPSSPVAGTAWDKLAYELRYFWRRAKIVIIELAGGH